MSNPTSLHKPFAVVPASALFELTIAADNGAPTAGDSSVANVTLAPISGLRANVNRFGPKEVMIKARFTGAGAALADVTAIFWQWDKDSSQWYATNMVPLRGVDAVSATGGSMAKVETDPNSRLGYIEIDGLDGDEDIVVVVTKVS
jgi:hypothetical protein